MRKFAHNAFTPVTLFFDNSNNQLRLDAQLFTNFEFTHIVSKQLEIANININKFNEVYTPQN